MPGINDGEWRPAAVFHLHGNFGTSSDLVSVLLTKELVQGEEVLGMHCFLHAFEAGHLVGRFGGVLGEWEGREWVLRVERREGGVTAEEVVMLEFCAGVALRGCAGDYDDDVGVEGWVGGRMMEQLEGVLWGVWLGMDKVEEVR